MNMDKKGEAKHTFGVCEKCGYSLISKEHIPCTIESHDGLAMEVNKDKIITFDKSALADICEMLDVPYDENIIGFTKSGVIKAEPTAKGLEDVVEKVWTANMGSLTTNSERFKEIAQAVIDFLRSKADNLMDKWAEKEDYNSTEDGAYIVGIGDLIREVENEHG